MLTRDACNRSWYGGSRLEPGGKRGAGAGTESEAARIIQGEKIEKTTLGGGLFWQLWKRAPLRLSENDNTISALDLQCEIVDAHISFDVKIDKLASFITRRSFPVFRKQNKNV